MPDKNEYIPFPYPPTRSPIRKTTPEQDYIQKNTNKIVIFSVVIASTSACCSLVTAATVLYTLIK